MSAAGPTKVCPGCGRDLPRTLAYYGRGRCAGGIQSRCRACESGRGRCYRRGRGLTRSDREGLGWLVIAQRGETVCVLAQAASRGAAERMAEILRQGGCQADAIRVERIGEGE